VSAAIVPPSETALVIFAADDGTFLGPFVEMRQHVSLEVLEGLAALRDRASVPLSRLIVKLGVFHIPTGVRDVGGAAGRKNRLVSVCLPRLEVW